MSDYTDLAKIELTELVEKLVEANHLRQVQPDCMANTLLHLQDILKAEEGVGSWESICLRIGSVVVMHQLSRNECRHGMRLTDCALCIRKDPEGRTACLI